MDINQNEPVLDMLKALADESRLALLRLLNLQEHTVGDLARLVNLGEPTVSHHLSRLRESGLVNLRMAGNQRFYRLNPEGLARFKRLVAEIERLPDAPVQTPSDDRWIAALGWDAWDQQVLRKYTRDSKLTRLPSAEKRMKELLVILRWLATLFQPERLYSEPEVNGILRAVYEEDYVSLRRDLVDLGYLRRERGGGKYWLAPAETDSSTAEEGKD